ncbi:aldo/keto reductase [Kangiella sp. TOML190]|uniref:aldo/keto reductase n=1 Tax=Kangiella sp. TOML190 TaxID=2931351 RepID=UPI00204165EB|nr:aldo/keto reductase [Kangiella sp. TOML190]
MTLLDKKIVVALQARTNSSRLPGKVLLPIAGMPLAVLAAKRASSENWDIAALTSSETTDDYLCDVFAAHGINYFRGDLQNVLKRFVDAFQEFDDETIIVRLTADNVFPDSSFIAKVIEQFIDRNLKYICADSDNSGLPYGMSAEVTKLKYLREALIKTDSAFDLEHVTPYIKRNFGFSYYIAQLNDNFSSLRCTVDTLDDYLNIVQVFNGVDSATTIDSNELISNLKKNINEKVREKKIVLGCVQLGLEYGVANQTGKPSCDSAHKILSISEQLGIEYFDTARAYGNSEEIIGGWLKQHEQSGVRVITKLSPLENLKADCGIEELTKEVEGSVNSSLKALNLEKLDSLMLHRASHVRDYDGYILKLLSKFKKEGVIDELGVSIQSPEELLEVLKIQEFSLIQIPFNILDYRWVNAIESLKKEKAKRNIQIHVRSTLLQGLLVCSDSAVWKKAHVEEFQEVINWLEAKASVLGCSSIHELCIRYVSSLDWVDALVIGAETDCQIRENVNTITKPEFSKEQLDEIERENVQLVDIKTLDPAQWSRHE